MISCNNCHSDEGRCSCTFLAVRIADTMNSRHNRCLVLKIQTLWFRTPFPIDFIFQKKCHFININNNNINNNNIFLLYCCRYCCSCCCCVIVAMNPFITLNYHWLKTRFWNLYKHNLHVHTLFLFAILNQTWQHFTSLRQHSYESYLPLRNIFITIYVVSVSFGGLPVSSKTAIGLIYR